MMNKEFTIKGYECKFRIKQMNAIELFALRTQIDFENFDHAVDTLNMVLEHIEVQCDETWFTVKDRNTYLPLGIDNDFNAIDEIFNIFMKEFKAVFQKSNASKS